MRRIVVGFCDEKIMECLLKIDNVSIDCFEDKEAMHKELVKGADCLVIGDSGIPGSMKDFYEEIKRKFDVRILILAEKDEWKNMLDEIADDRKSDILFISEKTCEIKLRVKKILSNIENADMYERINLAKHEIDDIAKLSIAGELVSSIGHMINNPITAVNLEIDLMKMDKSISKDQMKKLIIIEENIERITGIINKVRELKFGVSEHFELININDEVSRYIPVLHDYFINHRMMIDYKYDQKIPPVRLPVGLMKYIFLEIMLLLFHSGKDIKNSKIEVNVEREKEHVIIHFKTNFECRIFEIGLSEEKIAEAQSYNSDSMTIKALKNDILNANGNLEHGRLEKGFYMDIRLPLAKI